MDNVKTAAKEITINFYSESLKYVKMIQLKHVEAMQFIISYLLVINKS